jgi:hypothetical protein
MEKVWYNGNGKIVQRDERLLFGEMTE